MLISREALLLADDMGLGKTIQAISAIRILVYQKHLRTGLDRGSVRTYQSMA